MPKTARWPEHFLSRLPLGTLARLRGVQANDESLSEVVRQAIEREVRMRELDQDNATRVLASLRKGDET